MQIIISYDIVNNVNIKISQKNLNLLDFLNGIQGKKIVLFGAASAGKRAVLNLMEKGVGKKDLLFFDNNSDKWGKRILGIKVLSRQEFDKKSKSTPILITSSMFAEITAELEKSGFTNKHYIRSLLYTEHLLLKYDDEFINLLADVRDRCNMDNEEKFTLYSSMKAISGLSGEVAEVGVYKGGSAKILCEYKGDKEIHLFDTFEGLPAKTVTKDDLVKPGWLSDVDLNDVKKYLSKFSKVFFHKGLFPETADGVKNKKFCLVHLDTDIYQGTLDGLKFFWPRMAIGGRIISHDYNNVDCPGVKRAFREFFAGNLEKIIDMADTQAMAVKY